MSTSINRDRGRTPKNRRSKAQNLSFEGNEGSDIVEEKQGIEADGELRIGLCCIVVVLIWYLIVIHYVV